MIMDLLPEVEDDTIWENDRNEFFKSIEKKRKSLMSDFSNGLNCI